MNKSFGISLKIIILEGRAAVQVLEELIEQSWTALPRGALL